MKKLDQRFAGPFKIKERVGTHAYRLQLPSSMKIHNVFHVALLRKYRPPTLEGQHAEPPPPIEVDGKLEYEVSRIVDSRLNKRRKRIEYLVEWTGYEGTPGGTTWEPEDNLQQSQEAILDYLSRI